MEYIEEQNNEKININSFSEIISEKWNVDGDTIKNYIFANISLSLSRSNETKKDIDKIYMENKPRYLNAAISSNCIDYIVIKQGNLEQEIYARKTLGILAEAETDNTVRSKVVKLLRKHYPIVYNAVKKRDKEKLKNKYIKMDLTTRNMEARFDAAIYFYFAVYVSPKVVDQGFIISILNDIEDFEFTDLINQNIENELENYKLEIQEIRQFIKREYGKIFNYKDILRHNNEHVRSLGEFLEDLFLTNGLNINNIFNDSEFINIDKIILSFIRSAKSKDTNTMISSIASGVFIQSLVNEYKNERNLYFENDGEILKIKLNELEEKISTIENENYNLKSKLEDLSKEKLLYDKKLNFEINKLNNVYKLEMKIMEDKIRNLENKLKEEKNLRIDLESLREYESNINENYENFDLNKRLEDYIINKKIIIIGGDKEWRRRFRIKYPQIRTLNGFNENFEISVLNNSDYIFFYTKYMNHSTFHKAMSFIKFNQCKFGYIGKTNMELVEQEIIEKIRSYENE